MSDRKKSLISRPTKRLFKLHGLRNLFVFFDGYLYLKYVPKYVATVAALFRAVQRLTTRSNKKLFRPLISYFTERYHAKIVVTEDARKLITINEDVHVPKDVAESVIPYKHANQIIIRNPQAIVAIDCACRRTNNHDCEPANKCMFFGEPYASFMLEHGKAYNATRLTVDEASELLDICHQRGYVHNAYFKNGVGNQIYAICNCDPVCCVSISAHKFFLKFSHPHDSMAHSGRRPVLDAKRCDCPNACVKMCPFGAISEQNGLPVIDDNLCMGCGVCADICTKKAIVMETAPDKGIPFDMDVLPKK